MVYKGKNAPLQFSNHSLEFTDCVIAIENSAMNIVEREIHGTTLKIQLLEPHKRISALVEACSCVVCSNRGGLYIKTRDSTVLRHTVYEGCTVDFLACCHSGGLKTGQTGKA